MDVDRHFLPSQNPGITRYFLIIQLQLKRSYGKAFSNRKLNSFKCFHLHFDSSCCIRTAVLDFLYKATHELYEIRDTTIFMHFTWQVVKYTYESSCTSFHDVVVLN